MDRDYLSPEPSDGERSEWPDATCFYVQDLEENLAELEAKLERYRQMAEHYFSPSETDPDTCRRCSLNFRDPVHTRTALEDTND